MAYDPREHGADCDACPFVGQRPVPPSPSRNPRFIILGEGPSGVDEEEGKIFWGPAGRLLNRALTAGGLSRSDAHVTNTTLCRAKQNTSPKEHKAAAAACRPRLVAELEAVGKKPVLALGKWASAASCGKQQLMQHFGAIHASAFGPVLPSIHPGQALHSPEWVPVLSMMTERLRWVIEGGRWRWPPTRTKYDKWGWQGVAAALRSIEARGEALGVDVETSDIKPTASQLLDIGIADTVEAVSIFWPDAPRGIRALVRRVLAGPQSKTMHNGIFDSLVFKAAGIEIRNYDFDTMHAHALVAPRLPHKLDIISAIEFPADRWKTTFRATKALPGQSKFLSAHPETRAVYNARDSYMTVLLRGRLEGRLRETHRGPELLADLMGLTEIAIDMAWRGLLVDKVEWKKQKKRLRAAKAEIRRDLRKLIGDETFKPGSRAKVADFLVRRCGVVPKVYSKKTGKPSFNEAALSGLVTHVDYRVRDFVRLLLKYRQAEKLLSTYVEGLPIDAKWVVHPMGNPSGARTGRWAYSNPNAQNVPKTVYVKVACTCENFPPHRKDCGRVYAAAPGMRRLIKARPGKVFLELDYKSLEVYVLAFLSGDAELIRLLAEGNIHTTTAQMLFGEKFGPVEGELTAAQSKMRLLAKIARFSMHYGSSPEETWKKLVVDFKDLALMAVERMWKIFEKMHGGILQFHKDMVALARENDYVEIPLSGRRYYFYGEVEATKCKNIPIQGTGIDYLNANIRRVRAVLRDDEALLLQAHDSLLFEIPETEVEERARRIAAAMSSPVSLNGRELVVPVEVKMGRNWEDMKELHL